MALAACLPLTLHRETKLAFVSLGSGLDFTHRFMHNVDIA
jgi:hypothetical protein